MGSNTTPGANMNTYQITNLTSGLDLGTYRAETPRLAIDVMARHAGYADFVGFLTIYDADERPTIEKAIADLAVVEVSQHG